MKIAFNLTDEEVELLLQSTRLDGTLEQRLKFLIDEACFLSQADAEHDAEYKLYRMFGLTPPGVMFDDGEDIPF